MKGLKVKSSPAKYLRYLAHYKQWQEWGSDVCERAGQPSSFESLAAFSPENSESIQQHGKTARYRTAPKTQLVTDIGTDHEVLCHLNSDVDDDSPDDSTAC